MREDHPPPCSEEHLPDFGPLDDRRIAHIAKALAHPTRIGILHQFDGCVPRIAHDIVQHTNLAQSTVSEHLRILKESGVLFARKDGTRTWYCMRRSILYQFADAVNDLAEQRVLAGLL